jgi:hypothetical protein
MLTKAIQSHTTKTEASLDRLSTSVAPEIKGLRTDLREYMSSNLKRAENFKSTEERLIKKVENHNEFIKQAEATRAEKPSADAELLKKQR